MEFKNNINLYFLLILIIVASGCYSAVKNNVQIKEPVSIEAFSSQEDFKTYLEESKNSVSYAGGFYNSLGGAREVMEKRIMSDELTMSIAYEETDLDSAEPQRVSDTNVQVLGIDEPDIVKTDGKQIYFSSNYYFENKNIYFDYYKENQKTKIISAFPPEDLNLKTEIDKEGDLLLHNNILIIFSGNKIYGYNVSNAESPKQEWTIDLNTSFVSARLFKNKIYLITKNKINYYNPCPIIALNIDGIPRTIECNRIYHPNIKIPADTTYNAIVFDAETGEIQNAVSFIGTTSTSIVYMSENAIYITYEYYEDIIEFYYNFLKQDCGDLMPNYLIEKIGKLTSYDIGQNAKMTEFGNIFEQYFNSLNNDDRMKFENEISNRMKKYFDKHKRNLEKTGIVKINLNMEISKTGNVPGKLLNQFSLDEYNNYLRTATTSGQWSNSFSDIYVLDNDLNIVGSVRDLGKTEKIYSVRFLQDNAYVVTFRKIDPFYVLDLSDPLNPELKGELKIPGYSSYLHPIEKNKILGIGKEDSKIKISLFDVSNPENPVEVDKYILNEYWSDILNTHHAFLLDKKHNIFFLPGRKGGYVFSYENDKLHLKKTISNISAKRAIYIDDCLYIIGTDKIIVLDENKWEKIQDFDF